MATNTILNFRLQQPRKGGKFKVIKTLVPSPVLTGSGSKGMISARYIKAPPKDSNKDMVKSFIPQNNIITYYIISLLIYSSYNGTQ